MQGFFVVFHEYCPPCSNIRALYTKSHLSPEGKAHINALRRFRRALLLDIHIVYQ